MWVNLMFKGYFIVCEGLDAAGKTTTIKHALEEFQNSSMKYNKGLKSATILGKISSLIPSTVTLLMELIYQDLKIIRPALKQGQTIIQDRWYYSVLSYYSKKEEFLEKLFVPFLSKPDALIYFSVSLDERIKRLRMRDDHKGILEYPEKIQARERRLLEFYTNFKGPKMIIDTTHRTEAESAHTLCALIQSVMAP